jgi:hypothetical protein
MRFETMYKDFKIEFDSLNGDYIVYDKDDDVIKESKNEKEVIEYLDDLLKGKKNLDIPIIKGFGAFNNSIKTGKITSIVSYENGKAYGVWIDVDGDKTKEYISSIYAYTSENISKMNKINDMREKIINLREEIDKIEKTLTHPEIKADKETSKWNL